MKNTDIAYAAGAIDSDGNITIKRSTQRKRNTRDCRNAVYSPRMSLGQVTPAVPEFLKSLFGGFVYITKPGTRNSRPLFKWMVSDRTAARVASILLPHLKIKRDQASAVIALRDLKSTPGLRHVSYWYAKERPNWRKEELLTLFEVADILGYGSTGLVTQAIDNGTILAAFRGSRGRTRVPRIPRGMVERLASLRGTGKRYISPPQFIAAQHAVYEQVRVLNRLGINGTCTNHRSGYFAPIE